MNFLEKCLTIMLILLNCNFNLVDQLNPIKIFNEYILRKIFDSLFSEEILSAF